MPQFVLAYPATPPSFNKVGHSGSRWAWTKQKKAWQGTFETLLLAQAVPRGLAMVRARGVLVFATRRRRDAVNYRTLLEKCLGDALVGDPAVWPEGRWLPDDTPDRFTFEKVDFQVGAAPETRLILEVELSA